MKTIGSPRWWLTFASIDALLVLWANSALAAPAAGAPVVPGLPVLLLAGVGVLGFSCRRAA